MRIYHYPPTLTADAIVYDSIGGVIPPPAHPGYVRDDANLWRQNSEWEPCSKRIITMKPRKCGRAILTMSCGHGGCPRHKRLVAPHDCDGCEHASP